MSQKLIRILTLIGFFNFSGLNNGYSYIAEISPLNPTQSVSLVRLVANNAFELFTLRGAFSSAETGRDLVTGWTVNIQSKFGPAGKKVVRGPWSVVRGLQSIVHTFRAINGGPQSILHSQRLFICSLPLATCLRSLASALSSLSKQENYLRQEKQVWTKTEKESYRFRVESFETENMENFLIFDETEIHRTFQWALKSAEWLSRIIRQRVRHSSNQDPGFGLLARGNDGSY